MKIKISKRKNGATVSIKAASKGTEGVDLKDAVLGCVGKGNADAAGALVGIVKVLGQRGYRGGITKRTRNTETYEVSRQDA